MIKMKEAKRRYNQAFPTKRDVRETFHEVETFVGPDGTLENRQTNKLARHKDGRPRTRLAKRERLPRPASTPSFKAWARREFNTRDELSPKLTRIVQARQCPKTCGQAQWWSNEKWSKAGLPAQCLGAQHETLSCRRRCLGPSQGSRLHPARRWNCSTMG